MGTKKKTSVSLIEFNPLWARVNDSTYVRESFTFLRRTIKNFKTIINYYYKDVSFAMLHGRNVSKTSFVTFILKFFAGTADNYNKKQMQSIFKDIQMLN